MVVSLARHGRFLAAIAIGIAALAVLLAAGLAPARAGVAALDALFVAHMALTAPFFRLSTEGLRARASTADAGTGLIMVFAVLALAGAFWAIHAALNRPEADTVELVLAFAALPLGWATLNTQATFHYAHLYYDREDGADRGGLGFPGEETPGPRDFLYFALCVAMTSQVSDVEVQSGAMRRVVTLHALASFVTNTVILALAVNAAAG